MKQNYLQNLYTEIITPEEVPAEGEGEGFVGTEEAGGGGEEEEISEQAQRLVGESSSDRVQRQRAGVGARRAKRNQMEQEAAGYGVLAALTASGGSGSGSLAYTDILGEAGGSGSGLANAGELVAGTAALQAATGRGQRSRLAKGGGFGGEVGETGIDELISGTGVSGGASVTRRGGIQLAQETQVSGAGAGSSQRDPEVIDAIINQNKASVEYCYQSQLKLDPNLRGEIMLSFDILPTGKVGGVKIMNSTMNNSKVEQCIIRSLRRWSFPPQKTSPGIVTIRTKFIFG
jgi:TonB family protein